MGGGGRENISFNLCVFPCGEVEKYMAVQIVFVSIVVLSKIVPLHILCNNDLKETVTPETVYFLYSPIKRPH